MYPMSTAKAVKARATTSMAAASTMAAPRCLQGDRRIANAPCTNWQLFVLHRAARRKVLRREVFRGKQGNFVERNLHIHPADVARLGVLDLVVSRFIAGGRIDRDRDRHGVLFDIQRGSTEGLH